MPAELSVAQYLPKNGNVRHWALYLETPSESLVYQIGGVPNDYHYDHRENVHPHDSVRFSALVFVSEIESKDVEPVKILAFYPIITNVVTWSCQDWVLEALEALNDEEYLLSENYADVKERLLEDYQ